MNPSRGKKCKNNKECCNYDPSDILQKMSPICRRRRNPKTSFYCFLDFNFNFHRISLNNYCFIKKISNYDSLSLKLHNWCCLNRTVQSVYQSQTEKYFDFILLKRENSNRGKSCPPRFVKGFCILYLL